MDKNQKVNLAKAKKVKADELKRERQADEARRADTLEAFVRQLSDVVESGIDLNGLESLDVACDRVEKFSDTIKSSLTDIAKYVDHFYELELPEELIYKQVADPILLEKLEALGDNGELYSRLAKLDEALVLLAVAVEKAQKHGKRPEDYLPVRIVDGFDDQLRFVTIFSTGGGGGGGGTANGLTDEQLRASPVPVSATIDTTGLATETGQDEIIAAIEASVTTPFKPTDAYSIQAISDDGTYKYFFFEDASLNYYVMRKTLATGFFGYTKGTGGFATVYVNSTTGPSGSPTWASYGTTF